MKSLKEMLDNVRTKAPLIHNITNYVTVNDCANILIACGASPIMSDDIGEVEEITSICNGLNINIGTLNHMTIPSMFAAGKKSNELGHPVLLDPVGAGASALRTDTAQQLLDKVRFAVIRGNSSEIKALALGKYTVHGVDADAADAITDETLDRAVEFVKKFSENTGSIVAVTGPVDIVADKDHAYCIRNGHPMMSRITGSGCMLSAMTTAYLAANKDHLLEAAAASVCAMGLCGEKAFARMSSLDGNSTFRNYLIDAVYHLTPEDLESGAKYEIR